MEQQHIHYEPMRKALPQRDFPHKVTDGIWIWSVFSEEKNLHFNGYLVATSDDTAFIVDPPCGGHEVLDAFAALPRPECIILTNRDHERDSQEFKRRFSIPILAHEEDARLFENAPDRTFHDGDTLPGGWQVIHLPSQKSPGESALYHPERKILIVGDALIGSPMQHLSMLPEEKYADRREAVEGLRRLTQLDVKTVLVGDGDPVMQFGSSLIADALIH